MRSKQLLLGVIAIVMFGSCQKELTPEDVPAFCAISAITVKNGGSKITSRYDYEYDSVTRRVSMLRYQNLEVGTSKTIYPTYSNDTIYFASNSFLTFDASNRIETLTESDPPAGKDFTYYYTYNSEGYLNQRLIDDGVNDAVRTNFTYSNGNLLSFKQDYDGFPQSLSANVSVATSPGIASFKQLGLIQLFPELLLYMPAVQVGKISSSPLSNIQVDITPANAPADSFANVYSNYSLTAEGWLSSFQTDIVVNGIPESTIKYEFEYKCF